MSEPEHRGRGSAAAAMIGQSRQCLLFRLQSSCRATTCTDLSCDMHSDGLIGAQQGVRRMM